MSGCAMVCAMPIPIESLEPIERTDPRSAEQELGGEPELIAALVGGYLGDPFALLGPHPGASDTVLRVYAPPAAQITAVDRSGQALATLTQMSTPGLFAGRIANDARYCLHVRWPDGQLQQ